MTRALRALLLNATALGALATIPGATTAPQGGDRS